MHLGRLHEFPRVEVVLDLVSQQLSARYRRAWIGLAWMAIVPLVTTTGMAFAVASLLGVRPTQMAAHIIVSLLPYTLFSSTIVATSGSLIAQQEILRRHSLHPVVFPLSAMLVCVVEYLGASLTLPVLGPALHMHVGWPALAVPLGFLSVCAFATGLGLVASVAAVHLRDLGPLIQVGLSLLYWVTPILYTAEMIPSAWRGYLYLNPLTSALSLYTAPLIDGRWPSIAALLGAPALAAAALAMGGWTFARHARPAVLYL